MATSAAPPTQKPGTEAVKIPVVEPASAPPIAATPDPTPVNAAPELSRQQKIAALCEQKFLRIKELTDAMFSHEATCAKCGWHSMQHSKEAAYEMASKHVLTHWKDVTALL